MSLLTQGSFGLAVCCTLDPDRVVLAALNQPLSVGLAPEQRAVLYSSEAQSLKVRRFRVLGFQGIVES